MTAQAGSAASLPRWNFEYWIAMHVEPAAFTRPSHSAIASASARQLLRQSLRRRRNAVPDAARKATALRIARVLRAHILRPGLRIAIYSAFDGEIDVTPTALLAQRMQCRLFAPVIIDKSQRQMEFVRVGMSSAMQSNTLGIHEPRDDVLRRIDPRRLDVILVPVIAFDAHGWRLGFGGGYYDRKLAFRQRCALRKPILIGVGYEFQRVAPVTASHWDVKLDFIVTERGLRPCR
jgi:5-formyltetrahydrofolate cyclo-ligase